MRHLALLGRYFVQYAKVRLAYRADFLISVATMLAATSFGLAAVWLIFGRVPRLYGWSFHEIVLLYGFSLLPLALFNTLSINLYYFSENYIAQGKFDRVLLRPVNSLFQILFEQFRIEALGDAVLGIALVAASAAELGLEPGAADVALLAAASLCGAVIYLSVFIALASVSFWAEDRVGVMPPVYNMIAFGRYPMDIYGNLVRFVLSWIIPFGFAAFYPTAYLLRRDAYRLYIWLLPAVTAACAAVALTVWSRGVRRYSSTGS